MTVVRWEPAREMASLQNEVNRLFSTFFDGPAQPQGVMRRWIPAMDLVEREDHFLLSTDLPGLDERDVAIEVEGDALTISGARAASGEDEGSTAHRLERATGPFRRSVTLPDGVDVDQIQASFARGVLEIRIPKPEERKPRRVTIAPERQDLEGTPATVGA